MVGGGGGAADLDVAQHVILDRQKGFGAEQI